MNAILILFLLGVILLAGEVFVPGAVLGVLGAVCMLAGCTISFIQLGTGYGMLATVVALALLGLTLYVELVWLPTTRLGRKLIVQSTVDATSQPPVADKDQVIGKTGEALTALVPSGYVLIEGRRYEAFSQSGHVAKGTTLKVVAVDNFRLTVTIP